MNPASDAEAPPAVSPAPASCLAIAPAFRRNAVCRPLPKAHMTLDLLEHAVARDMALTVHPRQPWLPPHTCGGAPVLDALVASAGQGGLATGSALLRGQVRHAAR